MAQKNPASKLAWVPVPSIFTISTTWVGKSTSASWHCKTYNSTCRAPLGLTRSTGDFKTWGVGAALTAEVESRKFEIRKRPKEIRDRILRSSFPVFELALSQLASQSLHDLPDCLLIPPIPPPLPIPRSFDQPGFRENCHVVGNRRLRELNALFNFTGAETSTFGLRSRVFCPILQRFQNSPSCWISYRTQRPIERLIGRHSGTTDIVKIDGCQSKQQKK
jgi:hypothetical protein